MPSPRQWPSFAAPCHCPWSVPLRVCPAEEFTGTRCTGTLLKEPLPGPGSRGVVCRRPVCRGGAQDGTGRRPQGLGGRRRGRRPRGKRRPESRLRPLTPVRKCVGSRRLGGRGQARASPLIINSAWRGGGVGGCKGPGETPAAPRGAQLGAQCPSDQDKIKHRGGAGPRAVHTPSGEPRAAACE